MLFFSLFPLSFPFVFVLWASILWTPASDAQLQVPPLHPLAEWRAGVWILCSTLTWNHKCPHNKTLNKILNLCDSRKRIRVEFHYYNFKNFWCFVLFFKKNTSPEYSQHFKNHYNFREFSNKWKRKHGFALYYYTCLKNYYLFFLKIL